MKTRIYATPAVKRLNGLIGRKVTLIYFLLTYFIFFVVQLSLLVVVLLEMCLHHVLHRNAMSWGAPFYLRGSFCFCFQPSSWFRWMAAQWCQSPPLQKARNGVGGETVIISGVADPSVENIIFSYLLYFF